MDYWIIIKRVYISLLSTLYLFALLFTRFMVLLKKKLMWRSYAIWTLFYCHVYLLLYTLLQVIIFILSLVNNYHFVTPSLYMIVINHQFLSLYTTLIKLWTFINHNSVLTIWFLKMSFFHGMLFWIHMELSSKFHHWLNCG